MDYVILLIVFKHGCWVITIALPLCPHIRPLIRDLGKCRAYNRVCYLSLPSRFITGLKLLGIALQCIDDFPSLSINWFICVLLHLVFHSKTSKNGWWAFTRADQVELFNIKVTSALYNTSPAVHVFFFLPLHIKVIKQHGEVFTWIALAVKYIKSEMIRWEVFCHALISCKLKLYIGYTKRKVNLLWTKNSIIGNHWLPQWLFVSGKQHFAWSNAPHLNRWPLLTRLSSATHQSLPMHWNQHAIIMWHWDIQTHSLSYLSSEWGMLSIQTHR